MQRRELIRKIAILTGAAVAGGDLFLSGCGTSDNTAAGLFSPADETLFGEIAETIIPATDTPGARDAGVGPFMVNYATDCYDTKQQQLLKEGIIRLNELARKQSGADFIKLPPAERQSLLEAIDKQAKDAATAGGATHYFTLMKQMVLLGYFTSQPGATKLLRYIPVPGKYLGCIDYKTGEKAWV